jgi:FixJ family two-component response regulator
MIPSRSCTCKSSRKVLCPPVRGQTIGKGHRVTAGPLISIIDDDESMRSAVVALIRSAGYDADGFASAEEFLGCGIIQNYACIITDIQMPGMSGIELKQHLTTSQCQVPVIMITARHEPGLEVRALASGAACFLRKPFEADALIGCLDRALQDCVGSREPGPISPKSGS